MVKECLALIEHRQQVLKLGPPAVLQAADLDHDAIMGERLYERVGDRHLVAGGDVQVVPVASKHRYIDALQGGATSMFGGLFLDCRGESPQVLNRAAS